MRRVLIGITGIFAIAAIPLSLRVSQVRTHKIDCNALGEIVDEASKPINRFHAKDYFQSRMTQNQAIEIASEMSAIIPKLEALQLKDHDVRRTKYLLTRDFQKFVQMAEYWASEPVMTYERFTPYRESLLDGKSVPNAGVIAYGELCYEQLGFVTQDELGLKKD